MRLTKRQQDLFAAICCGSCWDASAAAHVRCPNGSLDYLNARQKIHPATVEALVRKGLIEERVDYEAGRRYPRMIPTEGGEALWQRQNA